MSEAIVAVAGLAGAAFGVAADHLAVRWPEHDDGVNPRRLDWRTILVGLAGAAVAAGLAARWSDPYELALLLPFAAALVVLLATDLDQRMLPDVLTLPLIGYAGVLLVLGISPLLAGLELGRVSGVAAGIGAPLLLALSDRLLRGGLGGGDLKLAVSIGLLAGVTRMMGGFLVASFIFALLLIGLILLRRVAPRSYVPFGPVLIGAAFVAMVMP